MTDALAGCRAVESSHADGLLVLDTDEEHDDHEEGGYSGEEYDPEGPFNRFFSPVMMNSNMTR